MTGLHPLTNCRCLALVDFSATRKTTKLAGTKDMATMIKMAMTTSVPCSLEEDGNSRGWSGPQWALPFPQLHLPRLQVIQGEASTGLVHGVVGDGDACTQEGRAPLALAPFWLSCTLSPSPQP